MKKESLWCRLQMMLRIALHYTRQHAQSKEAMKGVYTKQCLPLEMDFNYSIILKIRPLGSLYQVTLSRFLDHELVREETWPATYGWHSNGHLIEIGVIVTAFSILCRKPCTWKITPPMSKQLRSLFKIKRYEKVH